MDTESEFQIQTLLGLVQHYSPSGEEAEVVGWLVEHMAGLGYTSSFIDQTGNAVGVMGDGDNQLVLLGHIDTVPGQIDVRLQPDPQTGEQVLFGRGSVDAKGPLGAFVDAVHTVGPLKGWQLVVIGAVGEETDSRGARGIVDEYCPDFAVIGEPSHWDRITLGYKGSAWADVVVRQPVSHTAGNAASAPELAFGFWNLLLEWVSVFNSDRERVFAQLQPTLRGFSSSTDGFEDSATLKIGARLPLDVPPSAWYEILSEVGRSSVYEIQPVSFPIPAFRADRNSKLVRAFLGGIRAAGGKPGFVVKTGTADLNVVAPLWKCPAVAYGPGDSQLDHTPDEHLVLREYTQSVAVLTEVLRRIGKSTQS